MTEATVEKEARPLIINGALHCGNCKCPLVLEKKGSHDLCHFCGHIVGKLSDEQMIQLARDLPDEWIKKHAG